MGFGKTGMVDHFGILDIEITPGGATLDTVLELISSTETPVAQSNADALDINGDVAATAYYGNTSGTYSEATCEYLVKTGSISLALLKLGELDTGIIATSIGVSTDNSESAHPKITVSGSLGASAIVAPATKANTFKLPAITITANSFAQPIGFTVSQGELQSCSFEASCRYGVDTDGDGEPAAFGLAGAEATVSAEFVNTGTQPAWSLSLSGLTQVQAPTDDQPQAAWGTSTASARVIIARDAAPV
jgi:hypothetical protein